MVLQMLSVARDIPQSALLGLLTGSMSLHGGVVRDAAGRIVAHLASPAGAVGLMPGLNWVASAFQSYQLHQLGLDLKRVEQQVGSLMQLSAATTVLSGLNLAVSVAGFAYLSRKLGQINERLARLEKTARKIAEILTAVQHGRLQGAIDTLRHAMGADNPDTRRGLLMQSKQTFTDLLHQYKVLWKPDDPVIELEAIDDCCTLAMVGAAIATNELGLAATASEEFFRHHRDWQRLARAYAASQVLRDNPQRLLNPRYMARLPAAALIRLLDFSHDSARGFLWIDELRGMEARASMFRMPTLQTSEAEDTVIEFASKLVAKDEMLSGYAAHFGFLAEHGLQASAFNRHVETLMVDQPDAMWLCVSPH